MRSYLASPAILTARSQSTPITHPSSSQYLARAAAADTARAVAEADTTSARPAAADATRAWAVAVADTTCTRAAAANTTRTRASAETERAARCAG